MGHVGTCSPVCIATTAEVRSAALGWALEWFVNAILYWNFPSTSFACHFDVIFI